MFTIGDKMVCIDNEGDVGLTMGKIYISGYDTYIVNDFGVGIFYLPARFISLKEYRKRKIESLCLE